MYGLFKVIKRLNLQMAYMHFMFTCECALFQLIFQRFQDMLFVCSQRTDASSLKKSFFFIATLMLSLVVFQLALHWLVCDRTWFLSWLVEMGKCQLFHGCIVLKCQHSKLWRLCSQIYVCLPKTDPEISCVEQKENYLEIFPLYIVWMLGMWEDNIKIDLLSGMGAHGLDWSGAR